MADDLVRCFVCVEPGEEVRANLKKWIYRFRRIAPQVRWVKEDAYHVTLKFCGEIPYTLLYKLESAIEHGLALKGTRPFMLELAGIGAFPGFRQPRVLWAGIGGEDDQVHKIASVVERAAIAAGLDREKRPFHPHVTLARVPANVELPLGVMREINSNSGSWGEWEVTSVVLMRSDLRPEGPRYSPITIFDLKNDQEVH